MIFWDMTPRNLVNEYQCFEEKDLKPETVCSFEDFIKVKPVKLENTILDVYILQTSNLELKLNLTTKIVDLM
jgi:hypothetical protein